MKQISYYIILLIVLVITTNSAKAETVKIHIKGQTQGISQLKVVMINNGDEFYADSDGTIVINNLIAGKEYPIKIKFIRLGTSQEINAPILIAHSKAKQYYSGFTFVCQSTGECYSEAYIYL
jgi:hypothetical protein